MIGIFSAFGASLSWTYACFIWRRNSYKFKPTQLNLIKNLVAFLVFIPALININFYENIEYIFILFISGIVGIGLGDTFYIKSLKKIGTRRTLSIESISPIIAAFSGQVFIKERLSISSWIGILIVSLSLIRLLCRKNTFLKTDKELSNFQVVPIDYLYSFLSVFCAVIAAALSRLVFLKTDLNPFQTTEIRLLGAIIFLMLITKLKTNFLFYKLDNQEKINLFLSIIFGTNIGIFLQQLVFKTLPLGIGWTLLSTSPLISLFFVVEEEGEIPLEIIFSTLILCFGIGMTII